jgi:O-antigen ligase
MSPTAKAPYFAWLIFSAFLLFPVKRSVELPVLIMMVWGATLLYQHGWAFFRQPAVKFFTLLFACIWLPMLLSLPDSYDLKASGSAVAGFIRLYLAGLFIIWALSDQKQAALLVKLLAWLTAFWVADALFQAAIGHDLFGYARVPERLNGVFGERHLKLGNALPVLAPFLILALRKNSALMLLAAALTGAVVILAGSRGGWASFGVVCAWLILSETRRRGMPLWKMGAIAALVALIGTVAAFNNPGAKQRLDQTMLLFSGNEAKIDQALSLRLTLWKDGFAMLRAHPVNGIGVSTFRFAYPEFAQPGDPFMQPHYTDEATGRPTGASYAHQMVLEVTTETGLIGLAGLGGFYFLFVRYWRLASPERRIHALPFAMGLLAWIFPFNTHPSFYSAQWSALIWLMIAMVCASLFPLQRPEHPPLEMQGA